MKLSAPKVYTFWIAVALAVLGLLQQLFTLWGETGNPWGFWLVIIGFVVLALGNLIKGF